MLMRARDNVGLPLAAVLALLTIAPLFVTGVSSRSVLVVAIIYATGAVGLDLLTGYSGQFSFGQFVYFAVGAYVMAALRVHYDWPWYVAMLAGVVASGLVAAVVASALVRLKFFGSAVGTFFLGAVAVDILSGQRLEAWTGGSNGISSPPITIGGLNTSSGLALYYAAMIALILAAVACHRYTRTRAGMAARVVKENEVVAAVMGIRVIREKVRAQIMAGAVAGLGGCVLAMYLGYLSPETFNVTQSIELFAIVLVGGLGSIAGPIVGSVFFFGTINAFTKSGASSELFFALILLVVIILFHGGFYDLGEKMMRLARRALSRRGSKTVSMATHEAAARTAANTSSEVAFDGAVAVLADRRPVDPSSASEAETLLTVARLSVVFGGVKALDDVYVEVRRGEVHAIIGPNGAGKTTLLNCISGIQPASAGSIRVGDRPLEGLSISSRRKLGIARTFQHPSLVSDLDVLHNVMIGAFDDHDSAIWGEFTGSRTSRTRRRTARRRAVAALESLEFPQARWGSFAGDITMGEQKHVDIARAMAAGPTLLLLDEPTAGLGVEEMDAVARAIRLVQQSGVTIVVIAHHVGFIRRVADRCTVLDFGKVLAAGTPEDVLGEDRVVEVFVGTGGAS